MSSSGSWNLIHSEWGDSSLFDFLDNLFILTWLQKGDKSGTFFDDVNLFFIDFLVELWHSDFENYICLERLFCGNNFGTWIDIGLINDGWLKSCSSFDNEIDSVFLDHPLDSVGSDWYSLLIWIDLFGYTDGDVFGINSEVIGVVGCEPGSYKPSIDHDLNKFNNKIYG